MIHIDKGNLKLSQINIVLHHFNQNKYRPIKHYLSLSWLEAHILILKPNNDPDDSSNYTDRSISLTNIVCKINREDDYKNISMILEQNKLLDTRMAFIKNNLR